MTSEEQFEARFWHLAGIPKIAAWQAWQAATAAERERCAKVCESGINSTSSYRWESAVNWCADAIRKGE